MQRAFLRLFFLVVVGSWTIGTLLAAAPSKSSPKRADHPASPASLPVHIYGGFLVVVEGQIGGTSQGQNFVLDTGTSPSLLNLRVAHELGLALSPAKVAALGQDSEVQAALLPELKLGPLDVKFAPFLVTDFSAVEHAWKVPIAGILGLDVLGKLSFRLDFENQVLEFGDAPSGGIPVDYSSPGNLPVAEVQIAGKALRLLVDTGADRLVLFGNHSTAGISSGVTAEVLPGNGVAGRVPVRQLPALDLNWNGEHFRKDAVFVSGRQEPLFDGLLSVRGLGFRSLVVDAATQKIYLLK